MWFFKHKIKSDERGFLFVDGEFKQVLAPGKYRFLNPFKRHVVEVFRLRDAWISHMEIEAVIDSGALGDEAVVIDLKDDQRALVWVDGRFEAVLAPGVYALWKVLRDIRVEVIDARELRFEHADAEVILKHVSATAHLSLFNIDDGKVGVAFKNGIYHEMLQPGEYAYWLRAGKYKVYALDQREKVLDIAGQEIMTADKVTLRMNAIVTYQVTDPVKAVTVVSDEEQALYREAQLAIRAEVGVRKLDALLGEKDSVAHVVAEALKVRAAEFGLTVRAVGIRDIILPGDMKELLNQVIEAQKAAEANVIKRREETAAMRSQANTAKLIEDNEVLMKLRELEVIEKIAATSNLQVVLGDSSLKDRLMKLV